ncbi:MAG: cysteine desulfurase / selenocysteine lyase [Thermoplasmata archaeon]|jgi:cysteine desulfurase/selenocysteine lyase|nr:cysteine desulfurase / selenocysteine lyase [Thermoplasmata archaeon]
MAKRDAAPGQEKTQRAQSAQRTDRSAVSALSAAALAGGKRLDATKLRRDFPALAQLVHGKPLVYLDNAATSQKPRQVLDAMAHFYEADNSNVHRGVHLLSERATKSYESARDKVQAFIHAKSREEVVFTRGTTEAINLVANSFLRPRLKAGDEVLVSGMEHHSNIVPWQLACEATGAKLKVIPITDSGELRMDECAKLLGPRTKLVAVGHVSNALGTVNPVEEIVRLAHAKEIPVLIDGAQAVPHMKVDVQDIGCDFYAFSGHKMYGPTGIGVLYGRRALLDKMPPWQGGGDMIRSVSFEKSTYNDLPYKFEAGTPDIAGAIGLGAAVDFLTGIGLDHVAAHEHDLLEYATKAVAKVPGLRIIGTAAKKAGVLSFVIEGIHPHDIGSLVDRDGVAIRTGHHCAQPVMERFNVPATCRASFAVYNTREDVDALVASLKSVVKMFERA